MKWIIKYAVERVVEISADNINEVARKAEEGKREGEVVVSIRTR